MSDFAAGLTAIGARFQQETTRRLQASRQTLDQWGDDTATQMQDTARWVDRSGDARAGLHAEPDHPPELRDGGQVKLSHGVGYGRFLEGNPSFEVIQNTIDVAGSQLVSELDRIW